MRTRDERWALIDAAVERRPLFFVVTGAHFRRSLAWARSAEGRRNSVRDQVREKILNLGLGKPEPEGVRQNSTEV